MKKSGFTLVELLVVILIIAILATIGLVMYSSVQKSARIAKRIEDLKAIQTALELYYSVNKAYPITNASLTSTCIEGSGWRSECSAWGGSPGNIIPGLTPTYMPALPADPKTDKIDNSCYVYTSNGSDYKLLDYRIGEFTSADYLSQRNLVDPARDGNPTGARDKVDGTSPNAWAVWSSDGSICW